MPLSVGCTQMPNMPIDYVYHHRIEDKSKDQREKLAVTRYEQNENKHSVNHELKYKSSSEHVCMFRLICFLYSAN
jgi:hypothetical protein